MVRSIGESLSFISESITGPSATDTFTKRENTALIYNRRDTARESVTTQISTEYILFVSLFNNSKNGIAYRYFIITENQETLLIMKILFFLDVSNQRQVDFCNRILTS